ASRTQRRYASQLPHNHICSYGGCAYTGRPHRRQGATELGGLEEFSEGFGRGCSLTEGMTAQALQDERVGRWTEDPRDRPEVQAAVHLLGGELRYHERGHGPHE